MPRVIKLEIEEAANGYVIKDWSGVACDKDRYTVARTAGELERLVGDIVRGHEQSRKREENNA